MITEVPVISCPDCGRSIPPAMPEGLCPACLASAVVDLDNSPLSADAFDFNDDLDGIRYFGDYELLEEIGRGGMGIVYKARQLGVNRVVALKVLIGGAAAGRDFVHRFHTEAAAAANLDHPHIVPIYDFGTHEGAHFLAMKYLEGGTLQERIRREHIDVREAAELMVTIAEAVENAHRRGVLHRDLKPANILLDTNGQPYISDFGLAQISDNDESPILSGEFMGTIAYVAPEVVNGGAVQSTTLSDVYGLGAVLYELLARRAPFEGKSIADILRKVSTEEPALPESKSEDRNPKLRRGYRTPASDLQTLCLKCLSKNPSDRYGTARDLADDLHRFLNDEPVLARPTSRKEKLTRWTKRNPVVSGLIAAVCAALLLGATTTLWQLNSAWHNAAESQRHVARLNVLNGVNLMQDGDLFRSLLWFAEALEIEPYAETAGPADELRIASIIAQGPALVNIITHEGQPVGAAAFHQVKDQLATVGRDRRLRMWTIPEVNRSSQPSRWTSNPPVCCSRRMVNCFW